MREEERQRRAEERERVKHQHVWEKVHLGREGAGLGLFCSGAVAHMTYEENMSGTQNMVIPQLPH